jgi:hypothetical protein
VAARSLLLTWLLVGLDAAGAEAQMMGGGRDLQGGREAMSERLGSATPEQRAYLESLREQREGPRDVIHRVTIHAGLTEYTTGMDEVSEAVSVLSYSLRRPGMSLWVTGGPLRFKSGDTLSVSGLSPIDARLDLALGGRDSLRLELRAPSSPASLSTAEVVAIESVGTSTVDLASIEFGTPAAVGARFTHAWQVGARSTVSATLGGDYEPRPSAAGSAYWRGKTARLGVAVSRGSGLTRLSGGVDVTRSFSDSLGGNNLFQGGGTMLFRAGYSNLVGGARAVLVDVSAFYFRPFSAERSITANSRDPVGDFAGGNAVAFWPLGDLILTPTLTLSRESSRVQSGTDVIEGSGWSLAGSLGLDVLVARGFTFTPQVGYTTGNVTTELIASINSMIQRFGFSDSLRGWWAGADLSVSF